MKDKEKKKKSTERYSDLREHFSVHFSVLIMHTRVSLYRNRTTGQVLFNMFFALNICHGYILISTNI